MERHIESRLTSHAGLSALVSTRVYPKKLPQEVTYPCLVYEVSNRSEYPTMGSNADQSRKRITVRGYDTSYSGVKSLEAQIKAALDRYTGTSDGTTIDGSYLENMIDTYEDEFQVYGVEFDFLVWFR